jgi:ketosteroid isomerase-like protein
MTTESESAVVATVRRFIELYGQGDHDEAASKLDEDVVLLPAGGQSPINGRSAVRAWMEPETLAQPTMEALDFEATADKVIAYVRGHTRGIKSGIEVDWAGWAVTTRARRRTPPSKGSDPLVTNRGQYALSRAVTTAS